MDPRRHARSALLALSSVIAIAASSPAHADPARGEPEPSTSARARSGVAWLGISMGGGGELGVRVEGVVRGSPAALGGLREGDRIVTLDGARVGAPADVSRAVAAHHVGDTVTLGLERGGAPSSLTIVLAARPPSDALVRMHLVGAPAPAWSNVTPLSGAPASIAALKGKVVVLDFWASWCGPCRMIAPRLGALQDRLGAQGLAVVGMTTDPAEEAATFAQRHGMRYPTVIDAAGETSSRYAVTALPTIVIVDKKGIVRDVVVGFAPDEVEASVRKLLAEPGMPARPRR